MAGEDSLESRAPGNVEAQFECLLEAIAVHEASLVLVHRLAPCCLLWQQIGAERQQHASAERYLQLHHRMADQPH